MNKLGKKIGSILLIALGLFLIIYGCIVFNREFISYDSRVYTEAEVIEVKGFESNFDSTRRVAAINYSANGEEITSEINYHSVMFRNSDRITIYYDRYHPEKVSSDTEDIIIYLFIIGGAISLLIGILMILKKEKKKKKKA